MRSAILLSSVVVASWACGGAAPPPQAREASVVQAVGNAPASNSGCYQRAENVKQQFLNAWQTARIKEVNQAFQPLPNCEDAMQQPGACRCLSDTSCTEIVRPFTACWCPTPSSRGPGLPYQWPSNWATYDPCDAPAGAVLKAGGPGHFVMRDSAWGHSQTWDYKPAERFVFEYLDGTINEAFTENPASFHTVLCGDGRAYVETWLQWVNGKYESTPTCSTL